MKRKSQIKATNLLLTSLIRSLEKKSRENEAPVWHDVAEHLSKPKHKRTVVNLSRINRYTQKGDAVIVPGKVLAAGLINHQVTVVAFTFSDRSREKILKAKGKCLSIPDIMETNPKGTNVKIIG